jgi:hypothetical protein
VGRATERLVFVNIDEVRELHEAQVAKHKANERAYRRKLEQQERDALLVAAVTRIYVQLILIPSLYQAFNPNLYKEPTVSDKFKDKTFAQKLMYLFMYILSFGLNFKKKDDKDQP